MNDICEALSVIPPNPKGNEIWSHSGFLQKQFQGEQFQTNVGQGLLEN